MNWIANTGIEKANLHTILDEVDPAQVMHYHQNFSAYAPAPLRHLHALAKRLGVADIAVKDESGRFGLGAFKVLGASYAVGSCLCKLLHKDIATVTLDELRQENTRDAIGEITFATATDGNHGKGVAWTAKQLGYKAVIFMPEGSTQRRLQNIADLGAEASITDMNYDDTVRYVAAQAAEHGWVVVQDTAWEGYEDVPRWIMQGYSTTAAEVIAELGEHAPTHVFLQAGVGAFASVIAAAFTRAYPQNPPRIVVVEPDQADCFYRSVKAGKWTAVTGKMQTIMAGLACGEPNPIAWDILQKCGDMFLSVPDWMSANGMRILGNPLEDDARVVSGESGAVTLGVLASIMQDASFADLKQALVLDQNARVVFFSTEGDTDPTVYRKIVWEGAYAAPEQP